MAFLQILFLSISLLRAADEPAMKPQLRRFMVPVRELEAVFVPGKAPEEIAESLADKNIRLHIFRAEGLLKMYEEYYLDTLDDLRQKHIKPLEDDLGKFVDAREHKKKGEKLELNSHSLAYLQSEIERTKRILLDRFSESEFIREPGKKTRMQKIKERLEETNWDGPKKDRKLVVDNLDEQFKKVQDGELDMELLQEGIHELRRQVRWILILLQGLNGLVRLDNRTLPRYQELLEKLKNDPVAKGPFGSLPVDSAIDNPIFYPEVLYWDLSKFVVDMGDLKDIGEAVGFPGENSLGEREVGWLTEALLHSRESRFNTEEKARTEAARLMETLLPGRGNIYEGAKLMQKELVAVAENPISVSRKILKEQKNWGAEECLRFLNSLPAR